MSRNAEHQELVRAQVRGIELSGYGYHQAFVYGGLKALYIVPHAEQEGFAVNDKDLERALRSQVHVIRLCHLVLEDGELRLHVIAEGDLDARFQGLVETYCKLWRSNCKVVTKQYSQKFVDEVNGLK
tara:strand:+ start:854 stop:1234 length:381 start_codon:yes stop_codon:yes gene_type:complete